MYNFKLPEKDILNISKVLDEPGGIIAFPTDTVWGLGCLVNNKNSVERIYSIKERPKNKPLILLGSNIESLVPYVKEINSTAKKIIDKYLPGAVTVVLPKSDLTPDYLTSGFDTVGIRVPDYLPFNELLLNAVKGNVLATTSANISGDKTSITRNDVEDTLGNYVNYIMKDYDYPHKDVASTVVLVNTDESYKILRQGSVNIEI